MRNLRIAVTAISIVLFTLACKKSEKKEECTLDCKNGGTCVNNACNCPDEYSGTNCEIYYTSTYTGEYISTNFNCGQGAQTQTSPVSVDPGNKNRIIIGSLYADMTNKTHFNIPAQGAFNFQGSGTIDGKTMTLTYSGKVGNITTNCNGNFTKK